MSGITLSEKYVLLVRNEEGDVGSLFGNEKQGLYVSALLELYCDQIISGQKPVKINKELTNKNSAVKVMYDFVSKKENKSISSILNGFINPFNSKIRKELKEDIINSVNLKEKDIDLKAYMDKLIRDINSTSLDDMETTVLAKILIELKLGKKYISKEKRKELKSFFKNTEIFNEEIKSVMRVIDSLATAGALAGAGVV